MKTQPKKETCYDCQRRVSVWVLQRRCDGQDVGVQVFYSYGDYPCCEDCVAPRIWRESKKIQGGDPIKPEPKTTKRRRRARRNPSLYRGGPRK